MGSLVNSIEAISDKEGNPSFLNSTVSLNIGPTFSKAFNYLEVLTSENKRSGIN